jgi:hypothetical protein
MVKNPQVNGILEHVHQVLGQMLHTAKIDMANSVTPMTLMSFLTTRHWQFALPQYLKPHQVQPFLEEIRSLTFRSWLTGTKLESKGNH